MPTPTSQLKVSLGCMPFGAPGKEGARVTNAATVSAIVDVFQAHGHTELDTAHSYTGGTSEELLGGLGLGARGLQVATKFYPGDSLRHTSADLRKAFEISAKRLRVEKVDIFYLHACDRKTLFEETFKATDELYKEGKFARLGISNYMSWEVAAAVTLCRERGWVQPTVYQGIYNAVHRSVEPELFPCLRKFGLAFYEYNALGGGFFTGKHTIPSPDSPDAVPVPGSRFDVSQHGNQAKAYIKRYWNAPYFRALEIIQKAVDAHKAEELTMTSAALRWVSHHSAMRREYGDCVVIGVSSVKYMEENLKGLEDGPLPEDVVQAFDEAWDVVRPLVGQYWY